MQACRCCEVPLMNATLHRMKLVDCYRQLGLRDGAAYDAVKTAYRKLARQYHPDANPGDAAAQEKFVRIAQAYETLMAEIAPRPAPPESLGNEGLWNVRSTSVNFASSASRQRQGSASTDKADFSNESGRSEDPQLTLEQKLKQDIYTKLQAVLQAQRFPRAVALVEGLAQRLPEDAEVRQWQAITYQHWARQLCQTKQSDKARVYLRKALRVVPDNRKLTQELTAELERLEQNL